MQNEFEIELINKKRVYCKSWLTSNDVTKGVIFAIHGLNEHINRYNSFFNRFSSAGYDIYGFDLPGHGRTLELNANNDDLTCFSLVIEIIKKLIDKNSKKDVSKVLFGHSAGGLIGLYVLDKMHNFFNAAIIQGAALRPYQRISLIKEKAGVLMSYILPSMRIPSGLDLDGVSRNPKTIEDYKTDEYVREGISLILAKNIITNGKYFMGKKFDWDSLRVLISHGSDDRLTCCKATEEFARVNDFKYLCKEGWYHELHNDNEEEIFNDYEEFLGK